MLEILIYNISLYIFEYAEYSDSNDPYHHSLSEYSLVRKDQL